MSRFHAAPQPMLRPYVESYWGFLGERSQLRAFTVTPDCFVEVLFFAEPPWTVVGAHRERLPACIVVPLLEGPLHVVDDDGFAPFIAMRLHAWAAGLLVPDADGATHAWHDAGARFATLLPAVRDALGCGASSSLAALFDTALLHALAEWRPSPSALNAARAFATFAPDEPEAPATTGAAAEAERLQRSRRQVERDVRRLTTQSPSGLARLRRFHYARDRLWAEPDVALGRLALDAGYADQAHLTRTFRRYAGRTPRQFARDCLALRARLTDEMSHAFKTDGDPLR